MTTFKPKQDQGNPDPRADLKDYLQTSSLDITNYLKKTERAGIQSAYNEKNRPSAAVRVWVSFDFSGENTDGKYQQVDAWSKANHAETWGNSVRTFLWEWEGVEPTNISIARKLVGELISFGILNGRTFDDGQWKSTPDTSIYVFYRYKVDVEVNGKIEQKLNSNHFVLVLNAPIPHEVDYFGN